MDPNQNRNENDTHNPQAGGDTQTPGITNPQVQPQQEQQPQQQENQPQQAQKSKKVEQSHQEQQPLQTDSPQQAQQVPVSAPSPAAESENTQPASGGVPQAQPQPQAENRSQQRTQQPLSGGVVQGQQQNQSQPVSTSGTPPQAGPNEQAVTLTDEASGSKKKPPFIAYAGIAGVIILVLILGAVAMFMTGSSDQARGAGDGDESAAQGVPTDDNPVPTVDASAPWLSVGNQPAQTQTITASVGEEIEVPIAANLQDADINGYDLLFDYSSRGFEIIDVTTALDTFEIFQFDRGEYYSVTGIKMLSVEEPVTLNNQEIIKMKVVGKEPGTYYIEALPSVGAQKSQFVQSDVTTIEPQLQPIKIVIN